MRRFYPSFAALAVLCLLGALRPVAAQTTPAPVAQAQLWDATIAGDTTAMAHALHAGADVNALDTRRSQNGRRALNWAAIHN
ncbi:MAG TPA: hypothetical protein VK610_00775, partial [Rhodothermales bacterium]|nr:hypothetical protein [Rhodothermales bacterium]